MQLDWLRQHRPLVEALFQWSNRYARIYRKKFPIADGISLSFSEIQVIEYLLENEELQLNMAGVARRLGIPPVTFNDHAARLLDLGLLARYRQQDNCKNMILLVTPKGRKIYDIYSANLQCEWEREFLKILDEIPEESCEKFCQALNCLSAGDEATQKKPYRPFGKLEPLDSVRDVNSSKLNQED